MSIMATKWRTCDMKTVAFLIYASYPVTEVGLDQGKVFFEFEDTKERKAAVLAFWNKEQRVEPVGFLESLNRARDMVAQALRA